MIKNIIFDMGNVLIAFERDMFLQRLGITGPDAELLRRRVFHSVLWAKLDRGTLTDEEACEQICSTLPEHLRSAARTLVLHWNEPLCPIPGMYNLAEELHSNGYTLYLLSNASYRQHDYWPNIAASRFFTDTLISCDVKHIKPEPDIYALACEKFGIDKAEAVFIDDSITNCEGAVHWGLDAIVFHGDAQDLRRELRSRGVNVAE